MGSESAKLDHPGCSNECFERVLRPFHSVLIPHGSKRQWHVRHETWAKMGVSPNGLRTPQGSTNPKNMHPNQVGNTNTHARYAPISSTAPRAGINLGIEVVALWWPTQNIVGSPERPMDTR